MIGKRALLTALVTTAIGLSAVEAVGQSYPTRPIKMILPFPPGGPIDTMGRLVAQQMSAALGQNVYIENRAGGGARRLYAPVRLVRTARDHAGALQESRLRSEQELRTGRDRVERTDGA